MCDEDGYLFFKPVHQQEIDFYEEAQARHPEFATVMPPFYGVLCSGDKTALSDSSTPTQSESESKKADEEWVPNKNRRLDTHQYIVLENASRGFKHANILDAKLGLVLYDEKAPQAKKDRFDKIANETTHKNFNFRIAGMRVYHAASTPPETKENKKPAFRVEDDYRIYDKDYGRNYVNDDNLLEALRGYVFNESAGIDEELGKQVCAAFVQDLEKIEHALANEHSRMFSASCLFVFEGDGPTLRECIKARKAKEAERLDLGTNQAGVSLKKTVIGEKPSDYHTASRQDSGIGLVAEEEERIFFSSAMTTTVSVSTNGQGLDGDNAELDLTGLSDDEEEEEEELPKVCGVQLIDFAHATWLPGAGPDTNSLKGVQSLMKLFKQLSA